MVKVVTTKENRAGKKVKIAGIIVPFDENGMAEVSEERAEVLTSHEGSFVYLEGQVPEKSEEDLSDKPKKDGIPSPAEAQRLMEQRKAEKEAKAKAEAEAKASAEESVEESPEAEEESVDEAPEEESLDMSDLSFQELKDICTSENFPEEEWNKKKSKKDLISYIKSKL